MKRIFLTGMIAVALFATSAFAASFNVNNLPAWDGQANIASGSTDVEACAHEVGVDLTYDEDSIAGDPGDWDIEYVRVRIPGFSGIDCKGYTIQAALQLDDGSFVLTGAPIVGSANGVTINLVPNSTTKVADVVGVSVIFDKPGGIGF